MDSTVVRSSMPTDLVSGQTYRQITAKFVEAFFDLADIDQFQTFPTRKPFEDASRKIILDLLSAVSEKLSATLTLLDAGSTAEDVPAISSKHCEVLSVQDLNMVQFAIERDIMYVLPLRELLPEELHYQVKQDSEDSPFVNILVTHNSKPHHSSLDKEYYNERFYNKFYDALAEANRVCHLQKFVACRHWKSMEHQSASGEYSN